MIRVLIAAALLAGGTTIAMAQGAGGGASGAGGGVSTPPQSKGTATMKRDDDPTARQAGVVVCNGNVCWHTTERYDYPAGSGVIVREPGWAPGPEITFRERTGRGYWRDDNWVEW